MEVPVPSKIEKSRQLQQLDWDRLDSAFQVYQADGLAAAERFLEQEPATLRGEVLLQDLRRAHLSKADLREHYEQRYLAHDSGLSAFLLSRVVKVKAERKSLLEVAQRRDPDLLQVRVDLLSLEPFRVGNDEVLTRLLKLLRQDPGLAEGWRLLREIAPLYGRADFACAAADLEPWSKGEPLYEAQLDQVRTYLAANDPTTALKRLQEFELESQDALFLEASALAQLERGQEAWVLLQRMQELWPKEAMIHFNLAIVARDYMGQPQLAAEELDVFLELADEPDLDRQVPYFRKVQAWTWLRELRPEK